MEKNPSARNDVIVILAWVAIILAYVAIRANIVGIPLNRDEGVFGYIGQVILHHGLPYKDAIDSKPPGVFYLYSLALLFLPPTTLGMHVFLHLYNFLTLVALFFLARTYFRSNAAGLWTAFVYAIFSSSPVIEGFAASTEMFMLLPLTLSVLFAVIAARKENVLFACLSGLSGALACWTKQVAVFSIAFAFIYLASYRFSIVRGKGASENKIKIKLLAGWGIGAIGISTLIVAYFFFEGVLKEFYYWSFTYNFYYSALFSCAVKAPMFTSWLKQFLREDFIVGAVGVLFGLYAVAKKDLRGFFTLGFLALSFLGTLLGAEYKHYFAQIAPALSLAAGFGISELMRMTPAKAQKAAGVACGIILIGCPLVVNSAVYIERSASENSRAFFGNNPFPESMEIASYIASHSVAGDRVFIFGSEPQILFYAQRQSATPFAMMYPLTFVHPRYREFQQRVWRDISLDPPKFILIVKIPYSLAWDGKADLSAFLSHLDQLIKRDYHLAGTLVMEGHKAIFLYQKVNNRGP